MVRHFLGPIQPVPWQIPGTVLVYWVAEGMNTMEDICLQSGNYDLQLSRWGSCKRGSRSKFDWITPRLLYQVGFFEVLSVGIISNNVSIQESQLSSEILKQEIRATDLSWNFLQQIKPIQESWPHLILKRHSIAGQIF